MKTLYAIRHAKSSWADGLSGDFDRPLNPRGKSDAPKMGKRLKSKDIIPDLIISSPAKRARTTARIFADVLGYNEDEIIFVPELYLASVEKFYDSLFELPKQVDSVFLFSHNPGITDFVNDMANARIDNIPTTGIVCIDFQLDDWTKVTSSSGKVNFFDYPKESE